MRTAHESAAGLVVIARLIVVGAVVAASTLEASVISSARDATVQLSAATGTSALPWPPGSSAFAVSTATAPTPPSAVNSPGPLGIPAIAMRAYRNAERMMSHAMPACGVSWNLLAGIGYIESKHASGGATDAAGTTTEAIYGPTLNGSLPGTQVIAADYDADGHTLYARAMGPMQFLPSTWTHYGADGNGDGQTNPHNLFDATLAAARYLCSDGTNLNDPSQVVTVVLRYNNSMRYVHNVLGWAQAYVTGVPPVNLPPLTAPRPPVKYIDATPAPAQAAPADNRPSANGNPARRAGGASNQLGANTAIVSPPAPRGLSSQVGNGRNDTGKSSAGAVRAGNGGAPGVRVGNGRTGGARGAG